MCAPLSLPSVKKIIWTRTCLQSAKIIPARGQLRVRVAVVVFKPVFAFFNRRKHRAKQAAVQFCGLGSGRASHRRLGKELQIHTGGKSQIKYEFISKGAHCSKGNYGSLIDPAHPRRTSYAALPISAECPRGASGEDTVYPGESARKSSTGESVGLIPSAASMRSTS